MARTRVAHRRILVPLDGSTLADAMLRRVEDLAEATGAELVLVSVARTAAAQAALRRHLDRHCFALKRRGRPARARVLRGDPAAQILAVADHERPWCIAMATHGRSGPAAWVLGSVAERVCRESRHPVLVANPTALGGRLAPKQVVVPLDGSDVSASVLPHAATLARAFDAKLLLVHFVEPTRTRAAREVPPRRDVVEFLEARHAELAASGLRVEFRISAGHPATRLLELARADGSDLVAMATHGRSGLGRWLYGSVAETVIRSARCPLLIHRPAVAVAHAGTRGPRAAAPRPGGKTWIGVANA